MSNNKFKVAVATVIITLAALNLNGCAVALIGAGAEAGYIASQGERTAKETVNDQWITSKIKSKFLLNSITAGLKINVNVFKSNVTLKGNISSENEKIKAIYIAKTVTGVQSVVSKLAIQ